MENTKTTRRRKKKATFIDHGTRGVPMGRAIAFNKFCIRNYTFLKEKEPSFQDKFGNIKTSEEVYFEYLNWLKSK
jgi:hypothetical protein